MKARGRGRRPRTALLAVVLAASSCFRPVGPAVTGLVRVPAPVGEEVRLTYLGVGGWIFERGGEQILAAPLFTHPGLFRAGLWDVRSDTALVNRHMAAYDVARARAILVGHAHYDHLMDVPQVARRHAPRAAILGSAVVKNTLGSWSGVADRVVEIDDPAGDLDAAGRWIALSPGLRVLPLRSHHAAHFDGYTLYSGTTDRPLEREPGTAAEWVDGPSYAFLVDFLDENGGVAFRIYYQDAVAAPPRGLAPEALMEERPVDVAILVPATFDQVDWHPEALVENLRPRWVLLGHWEDFFEAAAPDARSLPLTDLGHFQGRLDRVRRGPSWRPGMGTVFVFGGAGGQSTIPPASGARPGSGSARDVPRGPRPR